MKTGTGVVGMFLALGALLVSAANSKTAEARPSSANLQAFKAPATSDIASAISATSAASAASVASAASDASAACVASAAPVTSPATAPSSLSVAPVTAPVERIAPPHLLENRGLRRLKKAETSPAMLQVAANIVKRHYAKPVGTEITVEVEGRQVIARIERHFHPEGGPVKPWGFHAGVSLFIAR